MNNSLRLLNNRPVFELIIITVSSLGNQKSFAELYVTFTESTDRLRLNHLTLMNEFSPLAAVTPFTKGLNGSGFIRIFQGKLILFIILRCIFREFY